LGSARGYIWSRTIPLLKEDMIIGSGPDTFALEFPQHEYDMKYQLYYTDRIIVDKSHNLFMQMFVEMGGVSACLFAFSLAMLYHIGNCSVGIRSYFLALLAAIGAFMFSDLTVLTAPFLLIIIDVLCGSMYLEKA